MDNEQQQNQGTDQPLPQNNGDQSETAKKKEGIAVVKKHLITVAGALILSFIVFAVTNSGGDSNDVDLNNLPPPNTEENPSSPAQIQAELDKQEAADPESGLLSTGTVAFERTGDLYFVCEGEGFPADAVSGSKNRKRVELFAERPLSEGFYDPTTVELANSDNRTNTISAPKTVDYVACFERTSIINKDKTCEVQVAGNDSATDHTLVNNNFTMKLYDLFSQQVVLEKTVAGKNVCPASFATIYEDNIYSQPDSDIVSSEIETFISTF